MKIPKEKKKERIGKSKIKQEVANEFEENEKLEWFNQMDFRWKEERRQQMRSSYNLAALFALAPFYCEIVSPSLHGHYCKILDFFLSHRQGILATSHLY